MDAFLVDLDVAAPSFPVPRAGCVGTCAVWDALVASHFALSGVSTIHGAFVALGGFLGARLR